MMITEFNTEKHQSTLNEWLMGHGKSADCAEDLPKTGFVSEDEFGLIAAGFVRMIPDCDYAVLEGLIANPMSFGKRRYFAIDEVVDSIVSECRKSGVQKVLAFTKDKATLKRSFKHGFILAPEAVIALEMKRGN